MTRYIDYRRLRRLGFGPAASWRYAAANRLADQTVLVLCTAVLAMFAVDTTTYLIDQHAERRASVERAKRFEVEQRLIHCLRNGSFYTGDRTGITCKVETVRG